MGHEQDFMRFLRVYKHDFLNHLQVILGYLQLKKPEQALGYVKEAIMEVEANGSIMRLKLPSVAFWLLLKELELKEQGISINLTTDAGFIASEEQEKVILNYLKCLVEKIGAEMVRLPYEKRAWSLSFTGQDILKLSFTLPREAGIDWESIFNFGTYPWEDLKLNTTSTETEKNYIYQLEISTS